MLWARPERTFCTRAHYADTPHCRTRRDPTLAPSASLSHALVAPLLHDLSGALLRRWPRPGGTPASAVASAMFGAAQATSARQLPRSTGRAYPPARRHTFVTATMPCYYRKVVAGDLIFCRRGASLVRLYKGSPSSFKASDDIRPSP